MASVEVFQMLIERIGKLEDTINEIKPQILQSAVVARPRLQDITAKNVDTVRDEYADRFIVRCVLDDVLVRGHKSVFRYNKPTDRQIALLKENGFRVFVIAPDRRFSLHHDGLPIDQYLISWDDDVLPATLDPARAIRV